MMTWMDKMVVDIYSNPFPGVSQMVCIVYMGHLLTVMPPDVILQNNISWHKILND